jgi:uncharacterized protein (DUF885 family)
MMDEGYLDHDPRFLLVMRKIRLRLLSNVILDVRMHTANMTDPQAMELMTKEAFQTQAEAEGKLRRAKLTSVQLPTYYVGLHDWLSLRKDYQARMGAKFNLAEFHNRALDEGPLPITLLRGLILPRSASPGLVRNPAPGARPVSVGAELAQPATRSDLGRALRQGGN